MPHILRFIYLSTSITYLPGVGPKRAEILEKELGIATFQQLLYYFPYKHIDRTRLFYIHELTADMPFVQVMGEILSFEEEGTGRKRHLIAHFTDGHAIIDLVWFQSGTFRWIKKNSMFLAINLMSSVFTNNCSLIYNPSLIIFELDLQVLQLSYLIQCLLY